MTTRSKHPFTRGLALVLATLQSALPSASAFAQPPTPFAGTPNADSGFVFRTRIRDAQGSPIDVQLYEQDFLETEVPTLQKTFSAAGRELDLLLVYDLDEVEGRSPSAEKKLLPAKKTINVLSTANAEERRGLRAVARSIAHLHVPPNAQKIRTVVMRVAYAGAVSWFGLQHRNPDAHWIALTLPIVWQLTYRAFTGYFSHSISQLSNLRSIAPADGKLVRLPLLHPMRIAKNALYDAIISTLSSLSLAGLPTSLTIGTHDWFANIGSYVFWSTAGGLPLGEAFEKLGDRRLELKAQQEIHLARYFYFSEFLHAVDDSASDVRTRSLVQAFRDDLVAFTSSGGRAGERGNAATIERLQLKMNLLVDANRTTLVAAGLDEDLLRSDSLKYRRLIDALSPAEIDRLVAHFEARGSETVARITSSRRLAELRSAGDWTALSAIKNQLADRALRNVLYRASVRAKDQIAWPVYLLTSAVSMVDLLRLYAPLDMPISDWISPLVGVPLEDTFLHEIRGARLATFATVLGSALALGAFREPVLAAQIGLTSVWQKVAGAANRVRAALARWRGRECVAPMESRPYSTLVEALD